MTRGFLLHLRPPRVPARAVRFTHTFGPLVRGRHYWSANLLIVVVLAHTARVFLTGASCGRRRINWWAGLGFLALHRECTHLGCTVPWDSTTQRFACPCHASAFDITGAVIATPAPRPLDLHPVRIENGVVKVDVGRRVQRQAFELSQVSS